MGTAPGPHATWPDENEGLPAGTRALLIGTGRYSGPSDLPDLPSVPATVTSLRDVLVKRCGVQPGNVTGPVLDPATPADIGHALVRCAETATDVLLVYYCGHGLIGTDSQLHLAASQSVGDDARLGFTAFSYQQLRQSLARCSARDIVVILDCCFAGRAADPAEGTLSKLAAPGAAAGGYLLASAAYSETALAPLGESRTAFGGALIRLLADGIPDGPRLITLNEAYKALDRTLSDQGRPRPRSRSSGSAGDLVLAVNRGYHPPPSLAALIPAGAGDEGAPYRGLAAYEESDARLFFGREALLAELRRELASQLDVPGPLVVLGSSGTGKSSLLRAGLRPSLDNGLPGTPQVRTWPKIVITPGTDPVSALTGQLGSLLAADPGSLRDRLNRPQGLAQLARDAVRRHAGADGADGRRLVIIADQFEDVFGPGVTREQRETLLTAMNAATTRGGDGEQPAVLAVVGLRADFYGRAQSEPFLAGALERKRTFDITAMTTSELRDAITRPADVAGLAVEPELTDRILADLQAEDLGSGTGYDTRLPLLSHALLATWRYREGGSLTVRGYQAAGGVNGAVARSAEQLWATDGTGQHAGDGGPPVLGEDERDIARRLLLQLVAVGPEETEVARRRVPLSELAEALGAEPGDTDRTLAVSRVLGKLVSARLVTVDREHAEIIHDSLLRTWPRLRRWIQDDRVNLAIGREVTEAAAEWNRLGRHRADLYSGSRLSLARQWESATGQLPALTADFLSRSVRAARGRRIGLAAALIAALVFAGIFVAVTKTDADNLQARQDVLESEQIAATANTLRSTDPELARDLALSAYHLSPTDQAAQSLAEASVTPAPAEINAGGGGLPNLLAAAFSPDGRLLATGNGHNGTITLWNNAESGRPALVGTIRFPHQCALAFLPGTRILAATCHGVTTLQDVSHPGHSAKLEVFGTAGQSTQTIAFSPDGRWLAIGSYQGEIQLWDISHRFRPKLAGSRHINGFVSSVAFSADSRVLAIAGAQYAWVTALRGNASLAHLKTVPGSRFTFGVDFSPRGQQLAAAGGFGLLLYNTADLNRIKPVTPPSWVSSSQFLDSVSYSPGGTTIAVGIVNGGAELGPAQAGSGQSQPYTLPSPGITEATVFSPDGTHLADADSDGIVRVWGTTPHPSGALGGMYLVDQQDVSPDGKLLVVPGGNGQLEVWDITDPARPVRDAAFPSEWASASFTGSGRTLITTNNDQTEIELWNLANPRSPIPVSGRHYTIGPSAADANPFGPDLAVIDTYSNMVSVFNLSNPGDPVTQATFTPKAVSASGISVLEPIFLSATILAIPNKQNNALLLWDLSQKNKAVQLRSLPMLGGFNGLADAMSSQCHTLATASSGQRVQLWDMTNPRNPAKASQIDTASNILATNESMVMSNSCLLAEATNAGTVFSVKVWNVRNPRSPRIITTLPVTGSIRDIEVSDDSSRIAALIQPPADSGMSSQTLDVWSVTSSGVRHQLAALSASEDMVYSRFIPNSHSILFNPVTSNGIIPDIVNPDPASTYRSLCTTTQRVLPQSSWSRYVPSTIPYEPPC